MGEAKDKRGLHFIPWDKVHRNKATGGLGIKKTTEIQGYDTQKIGI